MAETDKTSLAALGRAASSAQTIHAAMLARPIVSAGWLAEKTGLTPATVNKALVHLENLAIVRRLGENRRNRLFAYGAYLDILHADV
jgi:Fic family protein